MRIAEPVLRALPERVDGGDLLQHCEGAVVRLSLANLATFPWIAAAVAAERLRLGGFRFDIRTGVLARLEGETLQPVT
jgi:carbonic anhydrase